MCANDFILNEIYFFYMQAISYKSDVEHSIFSFLLYHVITINCICEPRLGSEANDEICPGDLPCVDSQVKILWSAMGT